MADDQDQYAEMDIDELERFAMKLDAARSGARRALEDAREFGLAEGTIGNLETTSDYHETLYQTVYEALQERSADMQALDEPQN